MNKVYFDSNIFITYFSTDRKRYIKSYGEEEVESIEQWFSAMRLGEITVVLSPIVITELKTKIYPEKMKLFDEMFNYRSIDLVDVNKGIAGFASELRRFYLNNPFYINKNDEGSKRNNLTTPDSLHLATAILYKCDQFFTFDDGKSPDGETGAKTIPLLKLEDSVAKYPIKIIKPYRRTFV
jgi:predicted nucleic acid-binding protein